jgi:radical SAM superfamily enzyme YgiQ (UPF0313 family)
MPDRSPQEISRWLDSVLHKMDRPVQWLGTEPNAECRDWDSSTVRVLLAASWPYLHGAGNQSIPAVYQTVHQASERFLADRCYLPETPRDMRQFERAAMPLFGVESRHQFRDFDVVGTSISYMVLLASFHKLLSVSGIPPRWRDREQQGGLGSWPMILIGGQAYTSPGAMEPIADCIFLGEAEDEPGNPGLGAVLERIEGMKRSGLWLRDRDACYRQLALEFSFLHFPRFTELRYGYLDRPGCGPEPSKQVTGYRSLLPGMALPRTARKVRNLDAITPLQSAPLQFWRPAMGSGDLEVARGCVAWCGFCRLSWANKPQRQRSVDASVEHAKVWQRNMGSAELSPFSPDYPMHSLSNTLLARLLGEVTDEIDDTAMRIDDFIRDQGYMLLQATGGADSVTLGLEGGSQRMRDLVGKGTSDGEVLEAVARGIRAGFRKFKIFMITNLPGEDVHDVMRVVELARKMADIRESMNQPTVRIQFSWTPLLVEAGTPMQWFAPTPADHTLIQVAEEFRKLKVDLKVGTKAEPEKLAFFQACQRASRDAGEALVDVLDKHQTACWGGVPNGMKNDIEEALRARGFRNGLGDLFDERELADLFGWEYISTGVRRELLWETYRQMVEFLEQTDSRTYDGLLDENYRGGEFVPRCDEQCSGSRCGVCSREDLQLRREYIRAGAHDSETDITGLRPVDQSSQAFRLRLRLERPERYRFVGNDHWRFAIRRAAYRAAGSLQEQLLIGGDTGIAKRSIRFASDGIWRDWSAGTDYCEFAMTRKMGPAQYEGLVSAMAAELKPWLAVTSFAPYPSSSRLDSGIALYSLEVSETPATVRGWVAAWLRADYVKLSLHSDTGYFGLGIEEVNAKELVPAVWAVRRGHRVIVRMMVSGKVCAYDVLAALAGKPGWGDTAARPAWRDGIFEASSSAQADFLRLPCEGCGVPLPCGLAGEPYEGDRCPRCADEAAGIVIAGHSPVTTFSR